MKNELNIDVLKNAMDMKGLNQKKLAEAIDVSRTIVTSWFKGEKFPRPDKLLKMGFTLGLPLNQLVVEMPSPMAPVVSFRKKMNRKTRDSHFEKAVDMAKLLEQLVDFCPFDNLVQPPTLKNPVVEYHYLQKVSSQIRKDLEVGSCDPIAPHQIIQTFIDLEVIIIPVLWGSKQNHGNALRIYLPGSKTTWIYLNLDSNISDFLFWMVHELGHVISPTLHSNTDLSEDFADEFAQALLFPKECAKRAYKEITEANATTQKVSIIQRLAKKHAISPITVYRSINAYADNYGKENLTFDKSLYSATTRLNKKKQTVSEMRNKGKKYSAADYILISEKEFKTPFFNTLKKYLSEKEKSFGFVQTVLSTTLLDAKEIHAELTR